jgi:hypothetical protein
MDFFFNGRGVILRCCSLLFSIKLHKLQLCCGFQFISVEQRTRLQCTREETSDLPLYTGKFSHTLKCNGPPLKNLWIRPLYDLEPIQTGSEKPLVFERDAVTTRPQIFIPKERFWAQVQR